MVNAIMGSVQPAQDALEVINPATGEMLPDSPFCTTNDQFQSTVDRARQAFTSWRLDDKDRRKRLQRCATVLSKRTNAFELASLLTQEQGKPKREALNEIYAAAHWFASIARLDIPTDSVATRSGRAEIRYEPLGVVGAITPWNYPVLLAACKIAPALLAGNTVILKPSPFTPLSTIRMVQLLTTSTAGGDAPLPQGAVAVVLGGGQVGNGLVECPEVAHVSFTGSTEIGKVILRNAASHFKRVTLELGGNDAAIVFADANIEECAEKLFWSAFTNAGQVCVGIKRLYVEEPIFEDLVHRLAELAGQTNVGDGMDSGTQMGPLAQASQLLRVTELVQDAKRDGAEVHSGGEPLLRPGFFIPPTIVTGVSEGTQLVDGDARQFQTTGHLTFTRHTCFVATTAGIAFGRSLCGGETPLAPVTQGSAVRLHDGNGRSLQVKPVWDPDRKELRVGDQVVKTFRQPALNQEAVLATFQDDEWPARIDDPLPPQPGTKPKERLKFTIRGLNRFHEQKGIISFRGDGTGEGVVWYFTADFQAARGRHAGPATRRQ